jgi:hypothetical protein
VPGRAAAPVEGVEDMVGAILKFCRRKAEGPPRPRRSVNHNTADPGCRGGRCYERPQGECPYRLRYGHKGDKVRPAGLRPSQVRQTKARPGGPDASTFCARLQQGPDDVCTTAARCRHQSGQRASFGIDPIRAGPALEQRTNFGKIAVVRRHNHSIVQFLGSTPHSPSDRSSSCATYRLTPCDAQTRPLGQT